MENTPLLYPPSITVYKLADFVHFRLLFEAWGGCFQQTSRGRFIGTAIIYQGMSVRAFQAETNQAIFTRGQDQTVMVTVIPITKANETTSWRGRVLTRGHILVKGPDVEYYNQTSRNTIIQALLVPLQTFTQMVGPLAGIMTGRKSLTSIAIQPSGGAMWRFQNSLDTLLSSLDPVHPDKAEFTEKKCLYDLSVCLLSGDADKRIKELGAKRLQLIDQALDIMNERIHKELKTEDICANLQVND